jgi:hypothetical protein
MKKNFSKIPKNILSKIEKIDSDNLIVECVKKIKEQDIKDGQYKHLNIVFKDNEIIFPDKVMPLISAGKYSDRNINGKEVILKDLPKKEKSFSFEAPDWGDWNNGSHEVEWSRLVYQRDFIPPKELLISIELLDKKPDGIYIFKFSVSETINKRSESFEDDLLFDINLLQENTGSINIFKSNTTRDEYLNSITINWEILPPGERDETIDRIISKFRNPNKEVINTIKDRYDFLASFKPTYIIGTSGFTRYLGAKLRDNFVIFENLEYGNAIYVMFEDWEELSKRTRLDLLKNRNENNFIRVVHIEGWKDRLKQIIRERLI